MTKVNREILKRYLNGKYNANDERYVTERFNDEESLGGLKKYAQEDWEQTNASGQHDFNHILESIHSKIRPAENSVKVLNIYRFYSRIAAVLLLPLAIWFIYNNLHQDQQSLNLAQTSIQAMHGSKVEFRLPDGTKGWLNGGSHLTYSTLFNERHVKLNGEAYFDVVHNEDKPFEVIGDESKVVVLGTRFSAKMSPDKKITEVVLESGKVKFIPHNDTATILKPGERLIYQKQAQVVQLEKVQTEEHTAWVKGMLIMRGDNLQDVADKLSDWYNVDVVLEGAYPKDYQFRATFKDESIEEVLRLMKLTAPIRYQIKQPKTLEDGTYSKMQVTLKMNEE
ncbi:FecR family protein [Carboxylicivirga marina]|uniref:FecR family protein n=1 Tax=Carboxylicivirga marina TaxID=2800988 RepID=A0ABS1HGR8_9BACT|nr:FecR family protein [Carboxylicivirga marina]MBK3516757.1 FecR family protein [Carboxylicivirga marina]